MECASSKSSSVNGMSQAQKVVGKKFRKRNVANFKSKEL